MERIYTINLKKEVSKTTRENRSNKAIRTIREFLKDHMKAEKVRIGESISKKIWEGGNQNPPSKIRIKAVKEDEIVRAELWQPSSKIETPKPKTPHGLKRIFKRKAF